MNKNRSDIALFDCVTEEVVNKFPCICVRVRGVCVITGFV